MRAEGEGNDEIGELVRSFNHMIGQIQNRNLELLKYQGELEQEIVQRREIEDQLRVMSVAFQSQESMIITDANGVILQVNGAFIKNTGYTAEETIGKTPRFLKSGRHDPEFYRQMWDAILKNGIWQGEIWNRHKNGSIVPELADDFRGKVD